MEPIRLEDVLGRERYGAERDAIRGRLVAHKRRRRVTVGDRLSFVFEDRVTVWYQTQEMLWVEQITDLDAVREELRIYNGLLPGPSEYSATMMIEIPNQEEVAAELGRLLGIDEFVTLEIGDAVRVPAQFESGRQTAEKLSAVQYVRFGINETARRAMMDGAVITLAVSHPNYRERAVLAEPVRASLADDLRDPEAADAALRRVRDGA